MIKIISILILIYVIQASAQKYAPRSVLSEELQKHHKPCTRRKDNAYDTPDVRLPTFLTRPVAQNSAIQIPHIDTKEKHRAHPHGEFFQAQNEILSFPQTEANEVEQATTKFPTTILVTTEKKLKERIVEHQQIVVPKHNTKNEFDDLIVIDDSEPIHGNSHEYENKLLKKIHDSKLESIQHHHTKEKGHDKVSKDCVISGNKRADEDISETRRFLSYPTDLEEESSEPDEDEDNSYRKSYGFIAPGNGLVDPARGPGVSQLSSSPVNLLTHSRVCYACSTLSNPTCWHPDRRTTVKYCRKGHEACVTKTFQTNNVTWILTRDCGKSCDDTDIPGPKYKSCSVCHADMCNDSSSGSPSIKADSIIISIFIVFIVKCAL